MPKSFLVPVVDGRISLDVGESLNGTKLVVRVEGEKTPAQNARWRKLVSAVTEYLSREDAAHNIPGPPRHESEVHEALKRAFLGVEDAALTVRSLRETSKRELSEAISRAEAYYSGLGVEFHHDERNHP